MGWRPPTKTTAPLAPHHTRTFLLLVLLLRLLFRLSPLRHRPFASDSPSPLSPQTVGWQRSGISHVAVRLRPWLLQLSGRLLKVGQLGDRLLELGKLALHPEQLFLGRGADLRALAQELSPLLGHLVGDLLELGLVVLIEHVGLLLLRERPFGPPCVADVLDIDPAEGQDILDVTPGRRLAVLAGQEGELQLHDHLREVLRLVHVVQHGDEHDRRQVLDKVQRLLDTYHDRHRVKDEAPGHGVH
mmetsp:Transcript_570/g.1998  ORF Transcript_570/g.1998 Transcript_570/m.1998 type:complete len:244 (+) Transcript_570:157-888(+)